MISEIGKKLDKLSMDNLTASSFATPKIRIKYFTCTKDKEHEGEVLNYVCVKKDCEKRGLLCSMCKIDHPNHTTIPLKILLAKLQNHKQKPVQSSQGFQDQLSQLEQIHKTMLYDLRVCVENLAEKFRQLEIQINQQFSKAKIQLLERVQINMKFNSFIEEAISNKFQNRQSFIQDMSRISGMLDVSQKQQIKGSKQKQLEVKFSANFDLVIKMLKNVQTSISGNFKKIQKFVCQQQKFAKYQDFKKQSQEKKQKGEKNKKKQQQIKKTTSISLFSPDYKSNSIVLQENHKVARQSKTGEGRFVFSNFHIISINQKIGFKIRHLKNWIGLGIAIRQKIKFLNFRFEYNNLGHGSYLISSNGYSWSHSEQANNIAVVNFKFKQDQTIYVQYQKSKLVFTNKNSNDKHELKIALNQAEEKDIYFCANLCSEGDSVEVLQA